MADFDRKLKDYLEKQIKDDNFSGVVLVAKDNEPIFEYVSGFANQGLQVPNKLDTKFNIASIGKMFTGIAIAKLKEEGKLEFDDKVGRFLTDYPKYDVAEKVTIHQLLTHTSGLGSIFNEKYIKLRNKLRTVKDYIEVIKDDPLLFEPGQGYNYSPAAYILLGRIIEVITKKDYFEFVKENIFKVAGMENSDYFELDFDTPNLAVGYTYRKLFSKEKLQGKRRNNLLDITVKGVPGGGEYSTVYDLLKFAKVLRANKLLSAKMTELITSPRQQTPKPHIKNGYGFYILEMEGHKIVGREGGFAGISTQFHMYQDIPYIVIILSNYDDPVARDISIEIAKLL